MEVIKEEKRNNGDVCKTYTSNKIKNSYRNLMKVMDYVMKNPRFKRVDVTQDFDDRVPDKYLEFTDAVEFSKKRGEEEPAFDTERYFVQMEGWMYVEFNFGGKENTITICGDEKDVMEEEKELKNILWKMGK